MTLDDNARAVLRTLSEIPNPVAAAAIYDSRVTHPDGYLGTRDIPIGVKDGDRTLKALEREGLVESRPDGRRLAWSLTAAGRLHAARVHTAGRTA